MYRDVLHPSRANVSKDELREKLGQLYKTSKDQVSVFGFRTQYGGGKSTGFALLYDSPEAMKKFEPHYRLVRYGQATKIEKASRQQRMSIPNQWQEKERRVLWIWTIMVCIRIYADNPLQANNGRTVPRSRVVRTERRSRRTNRRFAYPVLLVGGVSFASGMVLSSFGLHDLLRRAHQLGVDAMGVVTSRAMKDYSKGIAGPRSPTDDINLEQCDNLTCASLRGMNTAA